MDRRKFLKFSAAAAATTAIDAVGGRLGQSEQMTEALLQKNFQMRYGKVPSKYGDRLYTNKELLDSAFLPKTPRHPDFNLDFRLMPKIRIHHFFLRNGKEQTFAHIEKLGGKTREIAFQEADTMTRIFSSANIPIQGKTVRMVELTGDDRWDGLSITGGMSRQAALFGGQDDQLMYIESRVNFEKYSSGSMDKARAAGYEVDIEAEYAGIVANETLHALTWQLFPSVFGRDGYDTLTEPLRSFRSRELPELSFKNNAQADEFLSDVMNWAVGGARGNCFRFFNSLGYMDPKAFFSRGDEGRYWFSYQVQKGAMEHVLARKPGMNNESAKKVVQELLDASGAIPSHDREYALARQHFTEDDFVAIAKIYERVGVELLIALRPFVNK